MRPEIFQPSSGITTVLSLSNRAAGTPWNEADSLGRLYENWVSQATLSYSSLRRIHSILPWVLQIMAHKLIGSYAPRRYHPWVKWAEHSILDFLCILNTIVYSTLPQRNTLSPDFLVNSMPLSLSGLSSLLIEMIFFLLWKHRAECQLSLGSRENRQQRQKLERAGPVPKEPAVYLVFADGRQASPESGAATSPTFGGQK